jgi:S-adenosylmethionine:tRNA-ribosyltransferase-isomerase (queuine synthetase)
MSFILLKLLKNLLLRFPALDFNLLERGSLFIKKRVIPANLSGRKNKKSRKISVIMIKTYIP